MQSSLLRQLEEMQRYVYLRGNRPREPRSIGLPKTHSGMSGVFDNPLWARNALYEQEYDMAMQTPEEQRYRSFVERYVIERSPLHKDALKDGWSCILDAKALYKMIDNSAGEYRPSPETPQTGQAGKATAMPAQLSGATGPSGPPYGPIGPVQSIHDAYLQGIARGEEIARRGAVGDFKAPPAATQRRAFRSAWQALVEQWKS
jgi:hypothetical protein